MEVLKLENLSKYYTSENSVVVGLTGINLSFSIGEFVALTGESGSGKSTLAHVLGGILPYESGELYIYGQPTSHYDAFDRANYRRDLISFISQSYGILAGNTVSENVESALLLSGVEMEEARLRTDDILKEVELSEFKNRKAGKLSSGQKQRLSIARALAKPSKILIADEPTGNLDRENSDKVIKLLKRASKDRLVILITHEFEEARAAATRHIVLSDGAVVTDARGESEYIPQTDKEKITVTSQANTDNKKRSLAPYVFRLTAKSRPVFTAMLCLLLAVTAFITFVFLGTFITALDPAPTKIYNSDAFANGSPERLVMMKSDSSAFTEADYDIILGKKYVESIERFGYANDLIYYYQKETDHDVHNEIVVGPNYHPKDNPDDFSERQIVEFFEKDEKFIRTVPVVKGDFISSGKAPSGVYEVVSADSAHSIGDVITVYVRDKTHWGADAHIKLLFTVVGKTDTGNGLYFSESFASALSIEKNIYYSYGSLRPRLRKYVFLPYNEAIFFEDAESYIVNGNGFVFPNDKVTGNISLGERIHILDTAGERLEIVCSKKYEATCPALIILSDESFNTVTDLTPQNQISIYIKDYAYTDRVVDSLNSEGYIVISPFRLGASETDSELSTERTVTLVVCALALIIAIALQSILLKVMFVPLYEYYRLMSNTGLTSKTAKLSLLILIISSALVAEALSACAILGLNLLSVERIVSIFKHLDTPMIIVLFSVHFVSVIISLFGIIKGLGKSVFERTRSAGDVDFKLMEEAAL